MKAEWIDDTQEDKCLCCGQLIFVSRKGPLPAQECEAYWVILEALGYTREGLLTSHREQLAYQLPGMAEWLTGN